MQLEFFDIPSPCVGTCQSDEKGLCLGCMRTRDERAQWVSLSADDKQKVIKRCQQRKKRKDVEINIKVIDKPTESKIEAIQPSLLETPIKPVINNTNDFDFEDFEL